MQEITALAGALVAPVVVSVLLLAVLIALYRERRPVGRESGFTAVFREVQREIRELSMHMHREHERTRDLIQEWIDRAS